MTHEFRTDRSRRTGSVKRVCLLISSFHPRVGGGESHALSLCEEFVRTGLPVFVLTRRHDARWLRHDRVRNVPVLRVGPAGFRRWGKYLMLPGALFNLWRYRQHYDVIYVCGLRVMGLAGITAAQLLGKSCVLRSESCGEFSGEFIWNSPHQPGTSPAGKMLFQPLIRLRNRYYRHAAAFLAIAGVIRDEYLRHGVPEHKIRTIPNGIDLRKYHPREKAAKTAIAMRLQLPDKRIFIYSGKLNKGKGLETLLRAWQRLTAAYPDIHLVLAGGGGMHFLSCETALRRMVETATLQDSVQFTGYVNNIHEYLQASNYFVLPSESESFGISLIEAMACGLPCIGTATGGILDIIHPDRNGKLIPVNDEQALYDAMAWMLEHPDACRTLAARARKDVEDRFSIEHIASAHRALFDQL